MIYAGIGSRETPEDILKVMTRFAASRAGTDILRTGGAPGADTAFEDGARSTGRVIELYLPWPRFQGRETATLAEPSAAAMTLAAEFHPAWPFLKQGGRKLHARNGHQVLGADLATPADLIICWTPDGSVDGTGRKVGGTGQALRIASAYDIEVLNLQRTDHLAVLHERYGGGQR